MLRLYINGIIPTSAAYCGMLILPGYCCNCS